MTSAAHATPKKHLRLVPILAVVILLVLTIAFFVNSSASHAAREAAEHRVLVAGLPLKIADLNLAALNTAKARTGKDPSEWFARVGNAKNLWEMRELSVPSTFRPLLESARRREFGDDARVAFENFQASMEKLTADEKDPLGAWSAFWTVLDKMLAESDGTSDWGAAPENALRLLAIGLEPSMQLAREAKDYGAIDPAPIAAQLDAANEAFPRLLVLQELRLLDAVQVRALADAQSKHFPEALDDVRAGLAIARIHSPSFWLVGNSLWIIAVNRTLDALQAILPTLPRGLDLTDIEADLTSMKPRTEMSTAVAGERAFGCRVLDRAAEGWMLGDKGALTSSNTLQRVKWMLGGDRDRAAYIDAMSDVLDRLSKPTFLRVPATKTPSRSWWTDVASIITPDLNSRIPAADHLEARLALARAAIAAYRGGAAEALKFLSQSVDPFDGQPLRSATGDGGLIVFWSVGPDHKDDGAKDRALDVVWTLKLRE